MEGPGRVLYDEMADLIRSGGDSLVPVWSGDFGKNRSKTPGRASEENESMRMKLMKPGSVLIVIRQPAPDDMCPCYRTSAAQHRFLSD